MSLRYAQFWSNFQTREKRTILVGSALVLVTACYLLFGDLWTVRSSLLQSKTALVEEKEWMQEQSILSEQLNNNCRENQILALGNTELLELLASRNQLVLESFREGSANNSATYSLHIESSDGNSILRFIHQSACQGFTLANVEIKKAVSESNYSGEVEFSHEG